MAFIIREGQEISNWYLIISFISAELFFLLARSRDITNAVKKNCQRTEDERKKIEEALRLKLILEAIFYLPAKVVLFRLTIFYLLYTQLLKVSQEPIFVYATIGIAAYMIPLKWMCRIIFDKFPEALKDTWDKAREDLGD